MCFSSKRFILPENLKDEFADKLVSKISQYKIGNPLDKSTQVGPLAREDLFYELQSQIESGLNFSNGFELEGEEVEQLYGGEFDSATNSLTPLVVYVPNSQIPFGLNITDDPSILNNYENFDASQVENSNIFFREEIFGPVLPITSYPIDDLNLGIFIANSTKYGLGSTIIGNDLKLAEEVSRRLDFGMCFINAPVGSFSELPCGGQKASGWGRDCGRLGFEAFGNVKTLWI